MIAIFPESFAALASRRAKLWMWITLGSELMIYLGVVIGFGVLGAMGKMR